MINEIKKKSHAVKIYLLITLALFIMIMFHGIDMRIAFSSFGKIAQNFSTIFISIILEAIPFIMLGAFISALIQVFVTQETIIKILPKNQFLSLLGAGLMGLIFPVCECAVIPIARRLIKKGAPPGTATTFMLAVPLVNPVVMLSTYYAFYNNIKMVVIRGVFGFIAAVVIGFIVGHLENDNEVLKDSYDADDSQCFCGCGNNYEYHRNKSKLSAVLGHTSSELYNIGRYLIMGALISAAFQTIVSKNSLAFMGNHLIYSVFVMMALAFVMSVCSAADAFIAQSFMGQFTIGSIIAFLILGPMIDIKNTMMLRSSFKEKYVFNVITYVVFTCCAIGFLINTLALFGVIR